MFAFSSHSENVSFPYKRNENGNFFCPLLYNKHVCNVEHGTLTPPVFSVAGGMGPIATTFYEHSAPLLSDKPNQSYNQTICWLHCSLSFHFYDP